MTTLRGQRGPHPTDERCVLAQAWQGLTVKSSSLVHPLLLTLKRSPTVWETGWKTGWRPGERDLDRRASHNARAR